MVSNGSAVMTSQWEKTHCGKACPEVRALKLAVKPKDSDTGRWALTDNNGVPATESSWKTFGVEISTRKIGSWNLGEAVYSAA